MATVMVVGSGGREHAIALALAASPSVSTVLCVPGNGGTARMARVENIHLSLTDTASIVQICERRLVQLVVIGPEQPLADGLADQLVANDIYCFGPSAACARLESDKAYAKRLMEQLDIPTARWREFSRPEAAKDFIKSGLFEGYVVKAAGLAAGKGVVVAADEEEACAAVDRWVVDGQLSGAGSCLVIEERVCGEEVSLMCFADGHTLVPLPPAQDYKRLMTGDLGVNTGGMGAIAPSAGPLDYDQLELAVDKCLRPIVDHFADVGTPYIGCLYAGLMVAHDGSNWHVLEYNCRLGDPETQVLLPLLRSDIFELLDRCARRRLPSVDVEWRCFYSRGDETTTAVAVVLASSEYPAASKCMNVPISGLEHGDVLTTSDGTECYAVHAATRWDAETGVLMTCGGRVLSIVARAGNVLEAQSGAFNAAAHLIQFDGQQWRKDIAARACSRHALRHAAGVTYQQAGVDITAGDRFVSSISSRIKNASDLLPTRQAVGSLGGFGGVFDLSSIGLGADHPVLVSGTDGVGTKMLVGQQYGRHTGLGQDLVAMCVNDVLCAGARPLFFLDYVAVNSVKSAPLDQLIDGMLQGCAEAECHLIGGETAEMPDVYIRSDDGRGSLYDMAGFAVGAVHKKSCMLPHKHVMSAGDVIIGLPAGGLHSNGFSLVRRVIDQMMLDYDQPLPWKQLLVMAAESAHNRDVYVELMKAAENTLGEELLTPTKIYWRSVRSLLPAIVSEDVDGSAPSPPLLLAAAHITGGGLAGNLSRVLPSSLRARLDASNWLHMPNTRRATAPLAWFASAAGVGVEQLAKTFNLGVGMVLVVAALHEKRVTELLRAAGQSAIVMGHLEEQSDCGGSSVIIDGLVENMEQLMTPLYWWKSTNGPQYSDSRCRVGVLVSGAGSNMQAIVKYCQRRFVGKRHQPPAYRVVLVVSNRANAGALDRARSSGIAARFIDHTKFKTREQFDLAVHAEMIEQKVQLVCCAGFMRILSSQFIRLWSGRLVNIHPSLLPAFAGLRPHRQVLAAGVRVTGCTVHMIEEGEVDTGTILAQQTVPVRRGDTEQILETRVRNAEHKVYPRVINKLATAAIAVGDNVSPLAEFLQSDESDDDWVAEQ